MLRTTIKMYTSVSKKRNLRQAVHIGINCPQNCEIQL